MMNANGVGSLSSPIVISDDEDEACVELELEQRLSSPREGMELEFDEEYQADFEWQDNPAHFEEQVSEDCMDEAAPDDRFTHGTPRPEFPVSHIQDAFYFDYRIAGYICFRAEAQARY